MMRMGKTALLALLLAGGATGAGAAENLGCIDAAMTDAQRDRVYSTMMANQPVDTAIFDIIRSCATQHGWSEAAQRHAVMHTMGANLRRAMLRDAPVTPAQLRTAERAFDSVFSEAEARDMLANNMSEAASMRLAEAFIAARLPADPGINEWLGGYLAATQMEKISRIDFAAA